MPVAAPQQHAENQALSSTIGERVEQLRQLQRQLLEQAVSANTTTDCLKSLAKVVVRHCEPVAMCYAARTEEGVLDRVTVLHPTERDKRIDRLAKQLAEACQNACHQGKLVVWNQAVPARVIIAAPIPSRGGEPDALGLIFPASESTEYWVVLVHLITTHLMFWQLWTDNRNVEKHASDSAALLELVDRVVNADGLGDACHTLVAELQIYLPCGRVAIGTCPDGKCRLAAISGIARFDKHSLTARAIEAALDEAVLRGDVTSWPSNDGEQRHGGLSLKNLCRMHGHQTAVCLPLRPRGGPAIGALLLLDIEPAESTADVVRFVRAAERSIATLVETTRKLEGGKLARCGRQLGRTWRSWKGKVALALLVVLLNDLARSWDK